MRFGSAFVGIDNANRKPSWPLFHVFHFGAVQIVYVGGFFSLFRLADARIHQSGVREMAAVKMAINRINDKYDGILDRLLPGTKVCCI